MTQDKEIESWGFTWVDDYAERATLNNNGKEISIMAFEDDEFEIAWLDENSRIKEEGALGLKELKEKIDKLKGDQLNWKSARFTFWML